MRILTGLGEPVNRVAFSPDARLVLAASSQDVCLWALPEGKRHLPMLEWAREPIFLPDGGSLLVLRGLHEIWRFDLTTGEVAGPLASLPRADSLHQLTM